MSAVCVRAEMIKSSGEGGEERGRAAYELAEAFCQQARVRVDELFDRLWTNSDDVDRKLAERVLSGRYEWLEEGVIDPSTDGRWIADATPGPSKRESVRRYIR